MTDLSTLTPTLDHNGDIRVDLKPTELGYRLHLDAPYLPSKRLTKQLLEGLSIRIGGKDYTPTEGSIRSSGPGFITWDIPTDDKTAQTAEVKLYGEPLTGLRRPTDKTEKNPYFDADPKLNYRRLTSSEIRMMAAADRRLPQVPYSREKLKGFDAAKHAPITDLHTHISAQIGSTDLFDIARKKDEGAGSFEHGRPVTEGIITYPVELLEKLGIKLTADQQHHVVDVPPIKFSVGLKEDKHPLQCERDPDVPVRNPVTGKMEKPTCKAIRVKELNETQRQALTRAMTVPQHLVVPTSRFDLEYYRFRNPLVKRRELAHDMILKIAEDYQHQGVQYAQMFIGPLIDDAEWMREAISSTREAEEKYGVKLRYLNSVRRSGDAESMFRQLKAVQYASRHPYVGGLDIMGYEFNSTEDFAWALEHIAQWADGSERTGLEGEEKWNFKKHALIHVHADETGKQRRNGITAAKIADPGKGHGVRLQLSHILRSSKLSKDEEKILHRLNEQGLLHFTLCPASNVGYNNVFGMQEVPLNRWRQYAATFLGTDGGGILQTDPIQLAIDAVGGGWTLKDLETMRGQEATYLQERARDEAEKREVYEEYYGKDGKQPDDAFVDSYGKHLERARTHNMDAELQGRLPYLVMGAGGTTYEELLPPATHGAERHEISVVAEALRRVCRQEYNGIILGRTKLEGVSGEVDAAARAHRKKHPARALPVVGLTAMDDTKLPLALTHCETIEGSEATFVKELCERCMKLNPPAMPIFISGGDSTRQALRIYHGDDGRQIPYLVMSSAPGASQDFAPYVDGDQHFQDAPTMIQAIDRMWRTPEGQQLWGHMLPMRKDLYSKGKDGQWELDNSKVTELCDAAEKAVTQRELEKLRNDEREKRGVGKGKA